MIVASATLEIGSTVAKATEQNYELPPGLERAGLNSTVALRRRSDLLRSQIFVQSRDELMLPTSLEKLSSGRLLRIARLGSGPPLVLLHGYPDNLQIWSELAVRLADHFEVIAFDWPGMG